MSEITPQQLIEALTQFRDECHSNMEGCDLYEFIYWERGMVLAIEMIGYINREAPGVLETYDLLMEAASGHADWRCPEQGPEFIVWCMSREDFIAGAKWQANQSPEIADAIRKERERILDDLSGIISTSETTTMEEVREIIFGEEK